jgi:hypothetical protein
MIDDLDASLRAMISGEAQAASTLGNATISFAVPDATWRGQGSKLELDVYLYRVLENRELRSNERRPQLKDGTVTQHIFPARIECSYVISAWNKSTAVGAVEKEEDEHRLLSQLLYVLWRNPTIPSRYLKGLLENAEIPPPIVTAESEDLAAKPDFWNSLGTPVRPSITCRVTIAMDLDLDTVGPRVTTLKTTFGGGEDMYVIGGTIRSAADKSTIGNAWIRLDSSLLTYSSDAQGRFVINRISAGSHAFTVRAVGFREGGGALQVPNPSGNYDFDLTPLLA